MRTRGGLGNHGGPRLKIRAEGFSQGTGVESTYLIFAYLCIFNVPCAFDHYLSIFVQT